jgi:hypothetical protein
MGFCSTNIIHPWAGRIFQIHLARIYVIWLRFLLTDAMKNNYQGVDKNLLDILFDSEGVLASTI